MASVPQKKYTVTFKKCVCVYIYIIYIYIFCEYIFILQIFTEDLPEVEALPRDKVLSFLIENFKSLAIPYLVRTQCTMFNMCSM